MPARDESLLQARRSRFEVYEERLALSAHSIEVDARLDTRIDQHFAELTPLDPPDYQFSDLDLGSEQNSLQTHLANANRQSGVEYAHATYGFSGAGQTVAIIDSGIAYDHLSLGAGIGADFRVVGGYDFAEGDADPYDDGPAGFHGTHVAGIVGSDHSIHSGVAPNVDLVALRVFDDSGAGYFSWVEQALDWVHEHRNDFANPITTVNLSLGTSWNAETVPNWTTLEDEFAQLEADGIFIAASAGNSFADYNQAGLSYPAASPYVVPVASVDDGGNLSSFSQRHDRVLAAPGRGIVSTVPDHVFGGDGNPNDFGSASGTSMASPYVAGASVLVRQAMEFVGINDVTQDLIYDHLRNTADVFYDVATEASYHRINLVSAMDSLMPEDDYGSTTELAHSIGILSGSTQLSGLIGALGDADYFTFTAAAAGQVTSTVSTTNGLDADYGVVETTATVSGNTMTFDVEAGSQYTVFLQADDALGHYELTFDLNGMSTTVKSQGVLTLDSAGWLKVDGRPVWGGTQDFDVSDDGSLYWLGTNGLLQRRSSDGRWETIDDDVTKFAVRDDRVVFSLGSDNWLHVNGRQVWNDTQDFALGNDQTLFWHGVNGMLQELPLGGSWSTLDTNVIEFAVRDDGVVYSLDNENNLSVNGREIWGDTHDFFLGEDRTLYWQSTSGLLQQLPYQGSWQTIDTNVVEFAVREDGTVFSLRSGGDVSVDGRPSWSNIRDIRTDAAGNLLLEEMDGSLLWNSGPFGNGGGVGTLSLDVAPAAVLWDPGASQIATVALAGPTSAGGHFEPTGPPSFHDELHALATEELQADSMDQQHDPALETIPEAHQSIKPNADREALTQRVYYSLDRDSAVTTTELESIRGVAASGDTEDGVWPVDHFFDQVGQ